MATARPLQVIQRIRDKVREFKPQEKITAAEWEIIEDRCSYALRFLREDNPIYSLMRDDLQNAEKIILEDRIKEVHEIHNVTEGLKKVFITPKKIQVDQLTGQWIYVRDFLKELQEWIDLKKDLEKRESQGITTIERSNERRKS